jgi:hypothetical protein
LRFVNEGDVVARANDDLTLIAGPTIHGATASPVENDGNIEVDAGGLMSVAGNYSQGATGNLETELGGTNAASLNNLGSANTYSHLDVSGIASLNGTFQVSLTNGFAPQLGM